MRRRSRSPSRFTVVARIVEHIGSAHTEGELAALTAVARDKITAGKQPLDLGLEPESQVRASGDAVVRRHSSQLLWQALTSTFDALGFDVVADETFKALVCARLVEATSKLDTIRVLEDIGIDLVRGQGVPTRAGD